MTLNRKLFGDIIANYTAVCDSVLDESLMDLYREEKAIEEEEVKEEADNSEGEED